MQSEFEKTLKQHKAALTTELSKLGKQKQVQLAEWDIEQNKTDYEVYFTAGRNAQQSKIDELQKENSALVHVIKSRDIQLENEKHEYDELMNKLVDSGMQNKELQKRLDAVERTYAIFKALYFGFIPSWFYEKECHYAANGEGMNIKNYREHLILNLTIVKSLILKTEHESTHKFHKMRIKKWTRWS